MKNYDDIKLFLSKKNTISKKELMTSLSLSESDILELIENNDISIDENQYYIINIKKKDIDRKKSLLIKAKEEIKNNNLIEAEKLLLKYKNVNKSSSAHYQLFLVYYKQKKYIKAYNEILLAQSLLNNDTNTYNDQIVLLKELLSKQQKANIFAKQFKEYLLYLASNNKIDELLAFISALEETEILKDYSIKLLSEKNPKIVDKIKTYKKQ